MGFARGNGDRAAVNLAEGELDVRIHVFTERCADCVAERQFESVPIALPEALEIPFESNDLAIVHHADQKGASLAVQESCECLDDRLRKCLVHPVFTIVPTQ